MIADISNTSARFVSSYRPEPKAELPEEITPQDVLRIARELQKDHSTSWGTALFWAHQCRKEWEEAKEAEVLAKQAAHYRAFKQRRNCGKLVPATEVVGFRSGIVRASLTRSEKKAENAESVAKGLEPKHLLL